ncbi:hypothetical protein PYCC9005_002814 [Savitreella phatthalungensis]
MLSFLAILASPAYAYTVINLSHGSCGLTSFSDADIAHWHPLSKATSIYPALPSFSFPALPTDWQGKSFTRAVLADDLQQVLAPVLIQTGTDQVVVNWQGIWGLFAPDNNLKWSLC